MGVGLGVAVGDGLPTAAAISMRPHPYTLFGGPAEPHCVEEINTAELFNASRLAVTWCFKLGIAHHSNAIAPAMCGVAMDVPWILMYSLSLPFQAERTFVPGAVISGLIRLLPSLVTGPRLLKLAMVSVPLINAPTV